MRDELVLRLTNIALRGFSMGSRFLLILALAKLLDPSQLGLYGLLVATISFAMLLVGGDYYTYSHRELLGIEKEKWSFVIQHQLVAQVVLYLLLLPLTLLVFVYDYIPYIYLGWFVLLLLLEHVAQEINRLLVVMHKQLSASGVLLLRTGLWVWIALPLMWMNESLNNISTILFAWMVGVVAAILLGIHHIHKAVPVWRLWPLDMGWIRKGFKVGAAFLIATLCFRGLLTFDRYVVETLSGTEQLGVYVFYIGLVMGLMAFLEPAVFSFLYPRLVQARQQGDDVLYASTMKELVLSTSILAVILSVICLVCTPLIIEWIDKPIYKEHLNEFYILVVTGFIYVMGHIPHYGLYACKNDRWIVRAHILSMLIFIGSLIMFQNLPGIKAVSYSLLVAFSSMAAIKQLGYILAKRAAASSVTDSKACFNDSIR